MYISILAVHDKDQQHAPGTLMMWLHPCCTRITGGILTTGEELIEPVSAL